jgi:hypothetical protein
VRVDDASEMRTALKLVREQGEAIKGQIEEAVGGASPVASVLGDALVDKKMEDAQGGLLDELFLPSRVRIRLVLLDDEGREYVLQTQAEIPMTEPLWY